MSIEAVWEIQKIFLQLHTNTVANHSERTSKSIYF